MGPRVAGCRAGSLRRRDSKGGRNDALTLASVIRGHGAVSNDPAQAARLAELVEQTVERADDQLVIRDEEGDLVRAALDARKAERGVLPDSLDELRESVTG